MRRFSYCFSFAVATILVTDSAAAWLFKRLRGTELPDFEAQLQLNGELKAGSTIKDEKFLKRINKTLGIKRIIFLDALSIYRNSLKNKRQTEKAQNEAARFNKNYGKIVRLVLPESSLTNDDLHDECIKERRSLLVSSDLERLRDLVKFPCALALIGIHYDKWFFEDFKLSMSRPMTTEKMNLSDF